MPYNGLQTGGGQRECYCPSMSSTPAKPPFPLAMPAPTGPVTHTKAWIEMVHRYLATSVGVLITVLMVSAWTGRRLSMGRSVPVGLPTLAFFWVVLQGAFGMLTVTLKLYPAVVSTHLLLALGLLVILTLQSQSGALQHPIHLPDRQRVRTRRYLVLAALVLLVQIALGAWVSTNYAVLACQDFPTCQGAWWPVMDFEHGFALLRELGAGKDGGYLPFAALTAIHYTHRAGALVVLAAMAGLAWALHRTGSIPPDTEDLVDYTVSLRGVEMGILLMELEKGGVKGSLRSRAGADCAKIAAEFGGGGHKAAAGLSIDAPLDVAVERVLAAVRKALDPA